jgi:shikimate kinase
MGERPHIVFLIGFMGSGKTTVGRHLAHLLGWDFLDLDERIVADERLGIPQIFVSKGEAYFRRLETEILASLHGRARLVVACGGGTYAHDDSRGIIDVLGKAVWIRLPLDEALRRCAGDTGRPLLKSAMQAEELYRRRLPSYRAAPLHVDAHGLPAEAVAERIAALL